MGSQCAIPARARHQLFSRGVAAEDVMTKRRLEQPLVPSLACDVPKCAHGGEGGEGQPCLVRAVSCWLQDMVRYYDSLEWSVTPSGLVRTGSFPVSVFHGRPLSASIEDFIRKICHCAKLDESVVLVAAVYLSRIAEKAEGKLPISSCTVHRLLLQALTIGAKFTLDHPRSNKSMAAFADIPVGKFNQLEVKFLCTIQYDLAVSPADIAIAQGALQMTTVHTPCDQPASKRVKVDVLQDSSNQSSSVSGVAASNNSKVVMAEENSNEENSSAEVATNNYQVGYCDSDTISTALVGEDMRTPDLSNNNSIAMSPDCWSEASSYCPVPSKSTNLLTTDMLEPTKMSTPERLGSYTLVATAAE